MRISDWSSDVCSSDLKRNGVAYGRGVIQQHFRVEPLPYGHELPDHCAAEYRAQGAQRVDVSRHIRAFAGVHDAGTQEQQRDDSHGLAEGLQRLRQHELRSEERRVGKECVVRVDLGGRRIIKKKKKKKKRTKN